LCGTVQAVFPLPCETASEARVLDPSGNESTSDTSNRYVTEPTVPVTAALVTTSVGVSVSTSWPPAGDCPDGGPSPGGVTTMPAAWRSVSIVPAMVSVPVRAAPTFGATVNCTEPFPLPLAPCVIVMKAAPLVAVQV